MAFLVSCAEENNTNSEKVNSGNSETNNPVMERNLEMVASGLLYNGRAYSDDGYYEIISLSDIRNITYTDFASRKLMYLCSDITMDRDNPANTSYIPNVAGALTPIVTSKGLIIVSDISDLYIKYTDENARSQIYISDYSGENRRVLYTLDALEWIMGTSGIVEDGENLYFIEYYLADEKPDERNYLVSLSMEDGKKQTIMELDAKTYIIGAYDDKLIMKKVIFPDKEKLWYEQIRENYIYKYNPYTGDTEDIIFYKDAEQEVYFDDNKLLSLDFENRILKINDLQDNTSDEIDLNNIIDSKCSVSLLDGDVYDNRITLSVTYEDDNTDYLNVDITTKEWSYMNMYNGDSFCNIVAETEDEFMVTNGEYYYSYDYYMEDVLHTTDTRKSQFAMISKEDYWNNIPNFENIDYSMVYEN